MRLDQARQRHLTFQPFDLALGNACHQSASVQKELGQRIARLRKEHDLTQQQLANILGISQQTLAHYEVGRLRVAVAMLPTLAIALATTVEALCADTPRPTKRGPAPKLQQQMERISQLPRPKQRFVMEMLDTVLQQASR
ncbi:MAG: helix-turn-helix transcriptional regulator [Gammaproteobacteria bacterium]|nr:helix-turn-helix transcriptional regulator [Gammaproteobacteria bacterium]